MWRRYFSEESRYAGRTVLSYKAQKSGEYGFENPQNNAFSATVVLSAEKWFPGGWGLGGELAGWSDLGLGIAEAPRVSESITPQAGGGWRELSGAEVSQAYLSLLWGQSLWHFGRVALPKKLSPWLWSDRSAGVLDIVYDGVTVAYQGSHDQLWYAGWITHAINGADPTILGGEKRVGVDFLTTAWSGEENEWIFSLYYLGNSRHLRPGETKYRGHGEKEWSLWGSWRGTLGEGCRPGLQLVYIDGRAPGYRMTLGGALRFEVEEGAHRWRLTLAAINGGDYSMKTAGIGVGSGAFWGSSISGEFGSDSVGSAMKLGRVDYFYELEEGGRWYAGVALADFDGQGPYHYDRAFGARVGRRFEREAFFGKVEYRYRNMRYLGEGVKGRQRFRVDLGYRF